MEKKVKKAIIFLLIILIILSASMGYAYIFTDSFKSNKQLFFKYLLQNEGFINELKDEDLEKYVQKQLSTPYSNSGDMSVKYELSGSESNNTIEAVENSNITFLGNTDHNNKFFYQNVKVNYSEKENLDIELFKQDDIYGFRINNILKKFIAVENNNLKQWAEELKLSENLISLIPDKINIQSEDLFTEEEVNLLKEKYTNIIAKNLYDDMFSSSEELENKIYTMKITQEQVKTILTQVLENIKEDDIIINKIKQISQQTEDTSEEDFKESVQEQIDTYIENLKEIDELDNNQEIVCNIYINKKNLTKTEIIIDNDKLTISKTQNGIELEYVSAQEDENQKIEIQKNKTDSDLSYIIKSIPSNGDDEGNNITMNFKNITSLDNVEEICEYTYNPQILTSQTENIDSSQGILESTQTTKSVKAIYKNTKKFNQNLTINKIDNKEITLLNNKNMESIFNLIIKVQEQMNTVNSEQMQEIGLEPEENILYYYTPGIIPPLVMTITNYAISL